jgi:phage terminase Nu1 subunit (DNA packaging protein)
MPYTTRQLAKEAGVSMSRIRQLCISGVLHGQKFGHVWLISDEVAKRWLAERQREVEPPENGE